jgi:hypothetical protein
MCITVKMEPQDDTPLQMNRHGNLNRWDYVQHGTFPQREAENRIRNMTCAIYLRRESGARFLHPDCGLRRTHMFINHPKRQPTDVIRPTEVDTLIDTRAQESVMTEGQAMSLGLCIQATSRIVTSPTLQHAKPVGEAVAIIHFKQRTVRWTFIVLDLNYMREPVRVGMDFLNGKGVRYEPPTIQQRRLKQRGKPDMWYIDPRVTRIYDRIKPCALDNWARVTMRNNAAMETQEDSKFQ